MYINKRMYFDELEIEEFERQRKVRDISEELAKPLISPM